MTALQQFITDYQTAYGKESQSFSLKHSVPMQEGEETLVAVEFDDEIHTFNYSEMLLNPDAWQAVGKTRGWERLFAMPSWGTTGKIDPDSCEAWDFDGMNSDDNSLPADATPEWEYRWVRFINYLAEGKTIEDALSAIN